MAIGISGTSPELLIGITYDSNSAEKSFRQVTSRIESVAQAHEKRLNKILNAKSKQSPNQLYSDKYFAAQERRLQSHLGRVNNLYAKSHAGRRESEKRLLTASLNDHNKHNTQISNVVGKVTQSYNQQIPALRNLGSLTGVYAAQFAGMSTVLNQKMQSNSLGHLLAGGLIGKGLSGGTGSIFQGASQVESLKQFKQRLADDYRTLSRKITIFGKPFDEDSHREFESLQESQAGVLQNIKNMAAYHKQYNAETKKSNEALKNTNDNLNKSEQSSSNMLNYAKLTAVAYSAWKIGSFIFDLGVAAAKTEQMHKAFINMGGTLEDLQSLRDATFNTVTDASLLGTANYGKLMGIDIDKLPELLGFASVRAQQTGQSVDYMVQSIVMGLGRKSPMILDNLGLKMKDLQEEIKLIFKEAGKEPPKQIGEMEYSYFLVEAATRLAKREIKAAGIEMDNTAIKAEQMAVRWANAMDNFGKSKGVQAITNVFTDAIIIGTNQLTGFFNSLDPRYLISPFFSEANQLIDALTEKMVKKTKDFIKLLPMSKRFPTLVSEEKEPEDPFKLYLEELANQKTTTTPEKTWAEKLAEQIDAQAKLRAETLKHIAILEDYANKYKDNADVMKLVNDQLREQKRILNDLDVGQSLQPRTQFEFGPTNRFAGRIPDMNPVPVPEQSGMFKIMQDTTNEFNEMRKHLLDLEGALGFFEKGSAEAKSLQDEIKRLNEALNPKGNVEAILEQWNEFYLEYREIIAGVFDLAQGLFDSQVEALNNQLEVLQEIIRLENERWSDADARMQESGIKNTAYYLAQKKAHEQYVKGLQEREYKLKAKAWDADKDSKVAQTIMNTAQGIMGAWGAGPIIGAIMSALIASMGAVQLNTIMGQQNPYRRNQGGWIPGAGYGDNVNTLLTPGEFVVNRNVARENAQMLERINSGAAAEGGTTNVYVNIDGTIVGEDSWVEETLMPGISRAIRKGYEL